jgi:hypothetical protein
MTLAEKDAEIASLKAQIEYLTNPSDARCMEVGMLRKEVERLTRQLNAAPAGRDIKWPVELFALIDLAESCHCACSVQERLSGHVIGCDAPRIHSLAATVKSFVEASLREQNEGEKK